MSRNNNTEVSNSLIKIASRYYTNSKRLLFKSTRKPTRKELKITSRIVAIGILVVGFVGYIIDIIVQLTLQAIK